MGKKCEDKDSEEFLSNDQLTSVPTDFFNGMTSLLSADIDSTPFFAGDIPESLKKASTLQNFSANSAILLLKSLGFSYDCDREISTTDPEISRWTQWIFLQLLKRGLAYQAEVPVNWCPAFGTVLANEEIVDGVSERGGHPVIKKPMRKWMLRTTEYADCLKIWMILIGLKVLRKCRGTG